MRRIISVLIILIIFSGCAHVISKDIRILADKEIPALNYIREPDKYKGRIVILGGVIASSLNTVEGTYIEVIQKPLNYRGIPEDTDISYGRFLILYDGYLDTAIYSPGREITVAGEVLGKRIGRIGEMQYAYLLLKSKEIYLFKYRPLPIRFEIGIWHVF